MSLNFPFSLMTSYWWTESHHFHIFRHYQQSVNVCVNISFNQTGCLFECSTITSCQLIGSHQTEQETERYRRLLLQAVLQVKTQ